MTLECSQEVSNDLERLLETGEEYDVIIYTDENENGTKLHAHSIILRARSQYFREAFNEWRSVKRNGKFIFKVSNISPQFLKMILRFIYCGKVDLTKLKRADILNFLVAVDELKIQTLIEYIQDYLIKYHYDYLQQNPIGIFEYFYQHESVVGLWNYCLDKICEEPDILFKSNRFIGLKPALLEVLLKRDDLSLNEIVIWDSLIKWCLAQHPNISQEVAQWNKKEIEIMENTFRRFIPLIRFYEMSSDDFRLKVIPFKEILPKDLIDNVLIFHMTSKTKSNVNIKLKSSKQLQFDCDSVIIRPRHFAVFASLIEENNYSHYSVRNLPYCFNLLYRASRDGGISEFHARCDNKGATIVIAKILNSDQIVGGYNPLLWDSSDSWKSTDDSFIFSFTNKYDFQSAKVGYNKDDIYSIYCSPNDGPSFGTDLICLSNGAWGSKSCYYTTIDIPGSFYVEDYEVFQIFKRL